MVPDNLKGEEKLGEKHRKHNNLVNEAMKNNATENLTAINYEEPDLDNLYKIDVACKRRNVEYVLAVLKCEDMLYVSRAIKRSTWLITEKQYSYIMNSEYLYNTLNPLMTCKAFNKLILHVRLNLQDEKRVEAFFNYNKKKDFQTALRWLPNCSNTFIENIVKEHADDIPEKLLKRLYKKSFHFLEIILQSCKDSKIDKILPAMFLLTRNLDKIFNIIETNDMYGANSIGPKYTKIVMEKNSERILRNLEKYVHILDVATFAKFIRKEDAKEFILINIKKYPIMTWFNNTNIKYFLYRLSVEERFDFIEKYFIKKSIAYENLQPDYLIIQYSTYSNSYSHENVSSLKNMYSWYIYAPFIKAFADLKPLILSESNPTERIRIYLVLLESAGNDMKNILALLKFHREHYINESIEFKTHFVNYLLAKTDTHKYDKEAWDYLNELFNSIEVYSETDKNIQSYVKALILRHIINGENIPEIIEQKFEYENLDDKVKFNTAERDKIFDFLYKYLISKIEDDCNTEEKFDITHEVVVKVLNLLKHWNRNLNDYPFILQKIRDLVILRKEYDWNRDLSYIYNIKKSWRKLMFTESVLLRPTDETCINALKHSPFLLEMYKEEINQLLLNDNIVLERFFKKIRIYFHQSTAKSFKEFFFENLDKPICHTALIKGLCILLWQKEFLDFVHKTVPKEFKIDSKVPEELELCLQKHIATYMHLVRPQPSLAVVLKYARGDNLHHVLPSFSAILYNTSATHIRDHVMELINTPESLQKYVIRVAFQKLKFNELKNIISDVWESSQSKTIRNEIFCNTYAILCNEIDELVLLEIWKFLSTFIDTLTFEENKGIYVTLSQADIVPLSVRPAFVMKSYEFLKKLSAKTDNNNLISDLSAQMKDLYEFLEIDFMLNIYFEKFSTQSSIYQLAANLAVYMLSARTETDQMERYDRILLPVIDQALTTWDVQHETYYESRYNLRHIFSNMSLEFQDVVLKKGMIYPISMYIAALTKLQNSLPITKNYVLLTYIKLSLGYIQILHDLQTNKAIIISDQGDKWKDLHNSAAPIFGNLCLRYLKEDVSKYFPSIYPAFANTLMDLLYEYLKNYPMSMLKVLKIFVDCKDFVEGQLLALTVMPSCVYESDDDVIAFQHEMLNEISTHPSDEVAMTYWICRKDY